MPYTKSKIQRICSPEFQYWEVVEININDTQSFEIHWSDDKKWPIAEVYEKEDANLIASAPLLLETLKYIDRKCDLDLDIKKLIIKAVQVAETGSNY